MWLLAFGTLFGVADAARATKTVKLLSCLYVLCSAQPRGRPVGSCIKTPSTHAAHTRSHPLVLCKTATTNSELWCICHCERLGLQLLTLHSHIMSKSVIDNLATNQACPKRLLMQTGTCASETQSMWCQPKYCCKCGEVPLPLAPAVRWHVHAQ